MTLVGGNDGDFGGGGGGGDRGEDDDGGEKKFGETPGKEADTGERIWGNNPILSTPQLSLSLPQHQYPPLVLHLID